MIWSNNSDSDSDSDYDNNDFCKIVLIFRLNFTNQRSFHINSDEKKLRESLNLFKAEFASYKSAKTYYLLKLFEP